MTKRMNWRNASLSGKRVLSIVDEKEYRGQDAASRWLEWQDKKRAADTTKKRKRRIAA